MRTKEQRREANKRYKAKNGVHWKARELVRRKILGDFVLQQKLGKRCDLCREDDVTKLVFHHVDPTTKLFSVGSANRSIKAIVEELAKCVLWCKKCHNKYHHENRKK
jgi:hypothetical protein